MVKIRKAEAHEKRNYNGLHPLFGYTQVKGTLGGVKTQWTVPVEYLGEGAGEPNYEAILPKGVHLNGDAVHTVLGTTQRDLLNRLAEGAEPCTAHCGGTPHMMQFPCCGAWGTPNPNHKCDPPRQDPDNS